MSNLAPVGCYPAFLSNHGVSDLDKHGCVVSYNDAVEQYNVLLKEALRRIQGLLAGATVVYADTHAVKLELFRHPTDHGELLSGRPSRPPPLLSSGQPPIHLSSLSGLQHGTRACCGHGGGAYNFDPRVYCGNTKVIDGTSVTATACADPQNYVSWDGIHATEAANKLVAAAILSGSYSDPPFRLADLCDLHPIG